MVATTASTNIAAWVAANRRNAAKSSGPRTAEGKAWARANAVKHGLTGAGIALPTEVQTQVEARFLDFQEDLAPADRLGMVLIRQLALMSVRLERAARHEAAVLTRAVDRAAVEFDLDRHAEVERLFDTITAHPGEHYRRLATMPEGVDRLIAALTAARDQAEGGQAKCWEEDEQTLVEAFCGRKRGFFPVARTAALMAAVAGDYRWLAPSEPVHKMRPKTRQAWAMRELAHALDAEIARLTAVRAGFDPETLTRDREGR